MSEKTIVYKHHSNSQGNVLAVADKAILGHTLTEGKLSFTVSKSFYHGNETTEKELETLLDEGDNINLIGHACVNVALKKRIVGESGIIRISGIPHAQVYKLNP